MLRGALVSKPGSQRLSGWWRALQQTTMAVIALSQFMTHHGGCLVFVRCCFCSVKSCLLTSRQNSDGPFSVHKVSTVPGSSVSEIPSGTSDTRHAARTNPVSTQASPVSEPPLCKKPALVGAIVLTTGDNLFSPDKESDLHAASRTNLRPNKSRNKTEQVPFDQQRGA